MMKLGTILLGLALMLTLTHCATYDFSRRFVQQGNQLPEQKIKRLHIGMSKQDTAILMGTSLLSPIFNTNRWDYAYTWRRGSGTTIVRNLVLYFAKDRLIKIEHRP
jgi:outer membrane protein assembly factor BamE